MEKDFAVDTSGFATCRYRRWFNFKYGKESDYRIWLKAHIMCGVKTNIVTSAIITEPTMSDSPMMKYMVEETAENFSLNEVSADKAYLSKKNMEMINDHGATPFIPFKSNSRSLARGSPIWKKMYHYFNLHQEEFMKHYHKRSNIETVFHMIKTKFGESLKSKTKDAQVNELLCKIICHNLCVLIHEVHELKQSFQSN